MTIGDAATAVESRAPIALVSMGSRLACFAVDVADATLTKQGVLELPENVQYAWPHRSGDTVYVACSNGGPGGTRNDSHFLVAVGIDRSRGTLSLIGMPQQLPHRPVHITTDIPSQHALLAYSSPSGLSVHGINADRSLGSTLERRGPDDVGIYPHQVRIDPSNTMAVLVTRGHDPKNGNAEEPGALKIFAYDDGHLTPSGSIAPSGGFGFGPRHVDFHPTLPLLYASLERQNRLDVFALAGQAVSPLAVSGRQTLRDPSVVRPRQMTGTVHVHPNGKTVYIANRALGSQQVHGRTVAVGGETAIAVFAIDPADGTLEKIQDEDTRGHDPRTFSIDPSGRLLMAANATEHVATRGDTIATQPRNLSLFRILGDGTLEFARSYEFPGSPGDLLWSALIG